MNRWIRRALTSVIIIAGAAAIVYFRWFQPIHVTWFEARYDVLVVETMGTGTVEARTDAVISPKIQGRLVNLYADQGDLVKEGMVVARLDDSDLARQVEIAQANVEAAQAGVEKQEAEHTRATAILDRARREDQRVRTAFKQGGANETELDRAQEQLAVAISDSAKALSAIAESQKLLIAAEKTFEYQQAVLGDTIVRAPFDGLIVSRNREHGDIVLPGASIFRIISLDEIWISAWVDETALAALAPNQQARVILRSAPDDHYPGHVVRLGRETDRETREIIVDVAIDSLPQQWAIGQRAETYIQTERIEQALVVPLTFISVEQGQRGVFMYKKGRAVWTDCEFGAHGREFVEVTRGIQPGDVLVRMVNTDQQAGLRNGKRVVLQ